jgi:hypothetical protein
MLCPAQPYSLGSKGNGDRGLIWLIGIGSNL